MLSSTVKRNDGEIDGEYDVINEAMEVKCLGLFINKALMKESLKTKLKRKAEIKNLGHLSHTVVVVTPLPEAGKT